MAQATQVGPLQGQLVLRLCRSLMASLCETHVLIDGGMIEFGPQTC